MLPSSILTRPPEISSPVMSNYTDDARETPSDSSVRHDSSRTDILDGDALTAPTSSTAIDDVRWVGQPSSAGCDRLPPGREPPAQGTPGWTAHSLQRYRTSTTRAKSARTRSQSAERAGHAGHTGHSVALAPRVGGKEMGLQPTARTRPAAHDEDNRRSHSAHGPRESLMGIHAHSRRARQSGT